MKKYNLSSLPIIAIASMVAITSLTSVDSSAQQIYQWKDEKGRVYFGERPPRDQNSEKVSIKAPKYINGQQRNNSSRAVHSDKPSKEVTNNEISQQEHQKKKEAEYRKNCQAAKQLLGQMKSPNNTKFAMPDGTIRALLPAERTKKIAEAKASMDFYCK